MVVYSQKIGAKFSAMTLKRFGGVGFHSHSTQPTFMKILL